MKHGGPAWEQEDEDGGGGKALWFADISNGGVCMWWPWIAPEGVVCAYHQSVCPAMTAFICSNTVGCNLLSHLSAYGGDKRMSRYGKLLVYTQIG